MQFILVFVKVREYELIQDCMDVEIFKYSYLIFLNDTKNIYIHIFETVFIFCINLDTYTENDSKAFKHFIK